MSAIVSFGSCNVMLMGGGLAPLPMWGGLPVLQRGGWVAGLYNFGFSVMLKDVVVFFFWRSGGEVLVRAALFLFVVIGDVTWGVGCLVAFFLSKSFFFFNVSMIVSCDCDAQGS